MQEMYLRICGLYSLVESCDIGTLALHHSISSAQKDNPNLEATEKIMAEIKHIAACHCAICLVSQNEATCGTK